MKKIYIAPALTLQSIELQQIIALSIQNGNADESDGLVKENSVDFWGDNFTNSHSIWDDDWSD